MKKRIMVILIAILIQACKNTQIDKSVVIKIGKLEITRYEFERNQTRELIKGSDSSALKNKKEINNWTKKYIDKCFVIADAYTKQYDTLNVIRRNIEAVGNYMMTQRYGYLWKRTISPIVDTAKIVTNWKMEKRKRLYYFEFISAHDKSSFFQFLNNDSLLPNKEAFSALKRQITNNKTFSSDYFSIQWPFFALWDYKDYLFSMQEGHVSKLIYSGKDFLYLYLDHIEEIPVNEAEKAKLLTELQLGTESDLIKKESNEMNKKCKPTLNQTNINIIIDFLNKGNNINKYDKDIELIQYYVDDTLHKIGFKIFIDYYNQLLMRNEIKNKEDFEGYIMDYYNDDYYLNEARKLNLFESKVFKLDRKNYQNNLLYVKYLENEILNKIKIDTFEVINYYKNNFGIFKQPKQVTVDLYYFKSPDAASRNINNLASLIHQEEYNKTNDTSIIKGLIKLKTNLKIDMENESGYPNDFQIALLNTEKGNLSERPVLLEQNYVLIFKKDTYGESYRKLKDVYNYIQYKIKDEKSQVQLEKLLTHLKKEYKLEVNKTGID